MSWSAHQSSDLRCQTHRLAFERLEERRLLSVPGPGGYGVQLPGIDACYLSDADAEFWCDSVMHRTDSPETDGTDTAGPSSSWLQPAAPNDVATAPWPTQEWSFSTPEEQGMDPSLVDRAIQYAATKSANAVVVIRNGYIVGEWYDEGWNAETRHNGFSIAKSFTSAIVGMLIEDGLIEGLDQPAADFVPAWKGRPQESITIRNLLSMDSGLYWDLALDTYVLPRVPDQDAFVAALPLEHTPGTHWMYHNGAVQVLSEVIRNASGMEAEEYARQRIWSRIGMRDASWLKDMAGNTLTWMGVVASAREFAKFGYLYLREGGWDGVQIVDRDWVLSSTQPSQSLNPSYGHLWWLNTDTEQWPDVPADAFAAMGLRHQRTYVIPSQDLVVVRLGDYDADWSDNEFLSLVSDAADTGWPITVPWFAAEQYDAGDGPRSMAVSDLDGDGDQDLAVANVYSDDISVMLNNGDGTFAPEARYNVGDGPRSIAAGDLDGDGHADLAVANGGGGDVSVLINDGEGRFAGENRFGVGSLPSSLVMVDLDRDGHLDLAVANFSWPFSESNQVSVLRNNGNGTFAAEVRYDVGDAPHGLAVGDLDADGAPDLVTANSASQSLSVLRNNGDGTFASEVRYGTGAGPAEVTIGDLDGDGDLDLAVNNFWSRAGGGGGGPDDDVSVLLNQGDGTFAPEVRYRTGNGPVHVVSADVNGDGRLDLVVPNFWSNDFSILINRGDGTFANEVRYGTLGLLTGDLPHFVVSADLNGDGRLDVAMANVGSDDVSILLNIRSFVFP